MITDKNNELRFCHSLGIRKYLEYDRDKYTLEYACTGLENIDGYVSKDSLYRLLSNYRMTNVLTDRERSILEEITMAIKDMPNEYKEEEETTLEDETEIVKHGHLIDLPKAFDPSERPVKCSVCATVTSLYHGYKPRYCSNCGAKFDEEEEE